MYIADHQIENQEYSISLVSNKIYQRLVSVLFILFNEQLEKHLKSR